MTATQPSNAGGDVTRRRLRVRRNPMWLAGGILAVCLGGLASGYLFMSVAATDEVLKVQRTVYRGQIIAAEDLTVVSVGAGVEVGAVPRERLDEVVGRSALTDLPEGSLLVSGSWGDARLTSGSTRIGVRLEPGRYPSGLVPGSPVLIVAVPLQGALSEEEAVPPSVPGEVASLPAGQSDGSVVFDLTVGGDQAETVARLAATNRLSLVEQAPRR